MRRHEILIILWFPFYTAPKCLVLLSQLINKGKNSTQVFMLLQEVNEQAQHLNVLLLYIVKVAVGPLF